MARVDDEINLLPRLAIPQITPAARMLSRAFADYRPMRHYIPDDEQWAKAALFFFQAVLRYGVTCGEALVTSPNLEGVAVWVEWNQCPMTLWRAIRSGALGSLLQFGRAGGGKLRDLGAFADSVHAEAAPYAHWVLQVVGVDPLHQGDGHTGRLLRPMLRWISKQGLPCYTDTGSLENVSLYEYFGFRVVTEAVLPGTALPWWGLVRDPTA